MPLSILAKTLGRTEVSVMLKRKRLGMVAVRDWPTIYTSSTLSDALGIDRKTGWELMIYTPRVIDKTVTTFTSSGSTPWFTYGLKAAAGRRFPTVELYEKDEPMLAVYKMRLRAWLAEPLNHWFFCGREGRIVDDELRQVVCQAQQKWPDAWVSPGQAAEIGHVSVNTVNSWVKKGWLPGSIRYGNWRLLRSEVLAVARRQFH
jgi:hypothetical protein